jgi:RES domain-containing protein
VNLWRITRAAFQSLNGEGARLHGGRWNSEGLAVVYLSSSLSLAALEYLVHLDIEDAPSDLVASEVEVPESVREERVLTSALPPDWNQVADHPQCVRLGDLWLREGRTALLRVPSAVVPIETNVLLNPGHADAGRVHVISHEPFAFDRRLLG